MPGWQPCFTRRNGGCEGQKHTRGVEMRCAWVRWNSGRSTAALTTETQAWAGGCAPELSPLDRGGGHSRTCFLGQPEARVQEPTAYHGSWLSNPFWARCYRTRPVPDHRASPEGPNPVWNLQPKDTEAAVSLSWPGLQARVHEGHRSCHLPRAALASSVDC